MRHVIIPALVVIALLGLATLPSGYAQNTVGSTSQYLPAVFKAQNTPTLTITPTPAPQLTNGDFEQGAVGWHQSGKAIIANDPDGAHSGSYYGLLDAFNGRTQTLFQTAQVHSDRPILVFWSKAVSLRSACVSHTAYVIVNTDAVASINGFCLGSSYQRKQVDLSAYAGQVVTLGFGIARSDFEYSYWAIDDIAFDSALLAEPTATPRDPSKCSPAYPGVCIPPPPPDLNCSDIPYRDFTVLPPDPHKFDTDNDGIGCES